MKKTIVIACALCVLLGCASAPEEAPAVPEQPVQSVPTAPEPMPEPAPAPAAPASAPEPAPVSAAPEFVPTPEPALPGISAADKEALTLWAAAEKNEALRSRAQGEDIKAAATEKELFDQGSAALQRGDAKLGEEDFGEALSAYEMAWAFFDDAYQTALTKREQALEAMRIAREHTKAAENFALEADAIFPPDAILEEVRQ
ncbi:MAG: hypothetical protein LBS64_03800 [Spirochaetaceae bacterium]|nr:hypothetical protein [Spirochaetaceae bacterium]